MIPKIIHYCWFGGKPIPDNLQKYIDGWREKLPDYEIKEWNESNFDLNNVIPYVKEAYEVKKFAFVSDYVRLWALKEYGGVYLDADVEILKPFDDLLANKEVVFSFECDGLLSTAFIACEKDNSIIKKFLDSYNERPFILEDGSYNMTPNTDILSEMMLKDELIVGRDSTQNISASSIVYSSEYFSAYDIDNWHPKITEKTCTVHHMSSSWCDWKRKIYFYILTFIQKILGYKLYDKLKALKDRKKKR